MRKIQQVLHVAVFACVASTVALRSAPVLAQDTNTVDPHVKAVVRASPPQIKLQWDRLTNAGGVAVSRRDGPSGPWAPAAGGMLDATATSFTDDAVTAGRTYEYRVERLSGGSGDAGGRAYLLAGIEVPFPDDQGVVALVVDQTMTAPLAAKLDRLRDDLVAEGWTVVREEVDPKSSATALRTKLQQLAKDTGRLRAAILLGGVPRAYSGLLNPDGHAEHRGAWPADGYFGDLDGTWTDTMDLGGTTADRGGGPVPLANKAGDGKFDQTKLPSPLDIAVGRVDTTDLPAFKPLDATALLERYLDHDHDYRVGKVAIRKRTWVENRFGFRNGQAYSRGGFRDGFAIFGGDVTLGRKESGTPWMPAAENAEGYALMMGDSAGAYTGAADMVETSDFVTHAPRTVMMALFGSFFGDWSCRDNLLRAAIVSPGTTVETLWHAYPYAHLHSLGALHTFGQAFVDGVNNQTQNDGYDVSGGGYSASYAQLVHQALIGDPTLRMFVTKPPGQLQVAVAGGGATLTWTASADDVVGYHVYRNGQRLTTAPLKETRFVDGALGSADAYRYRVVAVQLLTTGSGTFFNHSPGAVFAKGDPVDVPPTADAGAAGGTGARDAGAAGSSGEAGGSAGAQMTAGGGTSGHAGGGSAGAAPNDDGPSSTHSSSGCAIGDAPSAAGGSLLLIAALAIARRQRARRGR